MSQCWEAVLMREEGLCNTHMQVYLVQVPQLGILHHCLLALAPHNLLHRAPIVKFLLALLDIMAQPLLQEAVMDHL